MNPIHKYRTAWIDIVAKTYEPIRSFKSGSATAASAQNGYRLDFDEHSG